MITTEQVEKIHERHSAGKMNGLLKRKKGSAVEPLMMTQQSGNINDESNGDALVAATTIYCVDERQVRPDFAVM